MRKILFVFVALLALSCVVSAQGQSWCGIQTLYFQHNASISPAGYEELINYPSGNPEVDENVSVINSAGPVLIDNYIIPEGSLVHTTELLQGLRRYVFYSYVTSSVGTTQLNFTAFRRFSNGTEQDFYTAMSGDINALTVTETTFNYVSQVNLNLNPTDRLGIRVSANTTHSAPIGVHWVYQGTTHASSFMTGFFVCEENPFVMSGSHLVPNELPLTDGLAVVGCFIAVAIIAFRKR